MEEKKDISIEAAKATIEADKQARTEAFLEGLKQLIEKHNCELEMKIIYIDGSALPTFVEELLKKQIVVIAK